MSGWDVHIVPRPRAGVFALAFSDDSVFADFDVDPDGAVFLRIISFDGQGADRMPDDMPRMDAASSAALRAMIDAGTLDVVAVERILRAYFEANRTRLWDDALEQFGLL